jgi:putative cell wall-binding protein
MRPTRRLSSLLAIVAVLAVATVGQIALPQDAVAVPVATNPQTYQAYGRVFPDPQGCEAGQPGASPFAEGNVCSTDFIQFDEMVAGFEFLETIAPEGARPFAEFMELQRLDEDYADVLDLDSGEGLSAGLPQPDLSREKSPLYMVKVTDERSDISEAERDHFVFSLSIHGIERAGAEGGIRAVEDFVTFGSLEPDRPLVETDPTRSTTFGEALRRSVIYFMLPNPDGWLRGDTTEQNAFYQRYNGNGIDLNRDWPSQGFTFRPYTPLSEPESRSYAKVLQHIKSQTEAGRFTGGNDLHGQLIDRAFSFTLVGGAQRSFDKNEAAVRTLRRIWADQETRLSWSPLIKGNEEPEACVEPGLFPNVQPEPGCDPTNRVYADQWGTIWDTIDYTVTGALGDWFDQPIGLDALGLDNEMSLSHLSNCGTGKCYDRQVEQLHVDGNKGLIYAQINLALAEQEAVFRQPGRTAYITNPERVVNDGSSAPGRPEFENLPPQEATGGTITVPPNNPLTFEVKGPEDGVYNGGFTVTVTYTNAQGVSPGAVTGVIVERKVEEGEPAAGQTEYEPVNADYNQSAIYAQAGMTVNVNAPRPGQYRVRLDAKEDGGPFGGGVDPPPGAHDVDITFTRALSWPDPGQVPYDVSNIDFFTDLNEHTLEGFGFEALTVEQVLDASFDLSQFDSIVLADRFMPGWHAQGVTDEGRLRFSDAERDSYLARLAEFAGAGGNLVLTDGAFQALRFLPTLQGDGALFPDAVHEAVVYAGHVHFNDGDGPTYATQDLAKEINQPGAAEGENNRHQTAEPVPVGYSIGDGFDDGTMPNWVVDEEAWEAAGGITVGTSSGVEPGVGSEDPNAENPDEEEEPAAVAGVSLGELSYGDGAIRIIGSVLPMPTEQFDHAFGLASYGVTYSGYQVFDNALQFVRPGGTWRLGGADRYETSTEVAYKHYNTVDAVVIANGENFVDALTAVPLAKALGAPILLTPAEGLHPAVFEYLLTRNPAPARAFVIGGENAVSAQVIEDLQRVRIPTDGITRVSGEDRYATSVAVSRALGEVTGQEATKAVIATGERFPDVLAAGPVAANYGEDQAPVPLLLTPQAQLDQRVADFIFETGISETLITGGEAAVSSAVEDALPSPTRVAGVERTETAAKLADLLAQLRGEETTRVTVATAENFPDAMVVGAPGGRDGIPTLLVYDDGVAASAPTAEYLAEQDPREVYVAGGFGVVSREIVADIEALTGR